MLHKARGITVRYYAFDVLACEGGSVTHLPYSDRRDQRDLLEALEVEGPHVRVVERFDDGQALFDATVRLGLEGVVAKRDRDPYRAGERLWIKTKNRGTLRFAEERSRAQAWAAPTGLPSVGAERRR